MTTPRWERIDGDTRGAVTGLAASAPQLTFATTPVGVYRSMDGGRSWQLSGANASVAFGECVAVQDNTIFAGAADGLHRSTDNGQTWQHVVVGSRVTSVCIGEGVVLIGTDTDGVLRSEDLGRSWSGVNAGLLDLEVLALSASPGFASDRLAFVGTASGLYRSRNGGDSWRAVDTGLNEPGIQCLVLGIDHLVIAGTEGDGIVLSADGGATWEQPTDLAERSVTAVAISPSGTIGAATDNGTFVSVDGGQTWRHHTSGPGGVLTLQYLEDGVLLAGAGRTGVWRSQDDGATWTESNAGLDASLLSTLVASPMGVWVAASNEGVRRWHGGSWEEHNAGLADTTVLGLARSHDDRVFAATPHGVYVLDRPSSKWSLVLRGVVRAVSTSQNIVLAIAETVVASDDLGRTWRSVDAPFDAGNIISLAADVVATSDLTETTVWRADVHRWELLFKDAVPRATMPIAVSSTSAGVFICLDRRVLSPDHQVAEFDVPVTAICISPNGAVWLGTTNGIFVSRDGGKTYASTSDGPRRVVAIAATSGPVYALELGGQLWRYPDSG